MENTLFEFHKNMKRLYTIAQQDDIYLTWKSSAEEAKGKYDRIMRFLPLKIQRIIRSYVECEVMRFQCLSNIACQHMDFLADACDHSSDG